MIRFIFIFFIGTCFISFADTASAQKFVPGYVLLNNGDTMKGYIQAEAWYKAPELVRFKSSLSGDLHTYSPLLIRSFRVKGGDWYFSFVGDIDPSSLLDDQLNYDPTPDTVRAALFIRVVVMGKISMYYARDKNDRIHLFIQKDGGVISELNYKRYYFDEVVVQDYRNQITRRAIMSNQIYKEQLINAFADCPSVATRILGTPIAYSKNDIMKRVISYNACKNSTPVFNEEKEKWRFEFGLHAGINYAALHLKSTTQNFFDSVKINSSLGYAAAVSINCIMPRTKNSWSIYNEVLVRNFKSTGTSDMLIFQEDGMVRFDLVYVKLINMVRYQFSSSKVTGFLNAGISNGLCLKDVNTLTTTSGGVEDFLGYFRQYEQGFLLGGGATYKKFSGDIRAEFSNGMSGYQALKSSFSTLYVMAGYTF